MSTRDRYSEKEVRNNEPLGLELAALVADLVWVSVMGSR